MATDGKVKVQISKGKSEKGANIKGILTRGQNVLAPLHFDDVSQERF